MFADRAPERGGAAAKADGGRTAGAGPRGAAGGRWRRARRVLVVLFAIVVVGLLLNHARSIDFSAVFTALRSLPLQATLLAAGLALVSHAVYSSYDLVGRRHTGHPLKVAQVLCVTFVSYAFNLNLGALVGGVAMRYRLYARLGLDAQTTSQVLALSLLTNWLGYAAVAGGLLLLAPPDLPPTWSIARTGLRLPGLGLCLAVGGYVALCFLSRRREWRVRGHALRLPSGPLALLQGALSSANWLLIGAVVHVLLQRQVDYPTVLGVLLLAAVAGVVTHVPAGIGVLEAVFLTLLSHRIGEAPLLAALLAYRGVYYLVPLALAAMLFGWIELRPRRRTGHTAPSG